MENAMYRPFNEKTGANWIWNRMESATEPECVLFKKTVFYNAAPESVVLNITADTSYLLSINGIKVARGPAKSQNIRYYDHLFGIVHMLNRAC